MDVTFHPRTSADYQIAHCEALMEGMRRHGLTPRVAPFDVAAGSDLAVIWSWKQMNVIADASKRGAHILVLERGFLQPREEYCSLAVDGFNGRGKFRPAPDGGMRWRRLFPDREREWRKRPNGYVLIIGQVQGDAALFGLDVMKWAGQVARELLALGKSVVFRPHPKAQPITNLGAHFPGIVKIHTGPLMQALFGAASCVTYNSTTAVEAVLEGVPTVTLDRGSIAWPVAAHDIDNLNYMPERRLWCHDMAWRQWSMKELADGAAWEHVKQCI